MQKWKVPLVTDFGHTFGSTARFPLVTIPKLESCTQRRISDAWSSNEAYKASSWMWTSSTCPRLTDDQFKTATWGTLVQSLGDECSERRIGNAWLTEYNYVC